MSNKDLNRAANDLEIKRGSLGLVREKIVQHWSNRLVMK